MSDPVTENQTPVIRFLYGRPEKVEAEIEKLTEIYACQNIYFYVVADHLEVAVTLIHMREIRKLQFMQGQIPPGLKMRPN